MAAKATLMICPFIIRRRGSHHHSVYVFVRITKVAHMEP